MLKLKNWKQKEYGRKLLILSKEKIITSTISKYIYIYQRIFSF